MLYFKRAQLLTYLLILLITNNMLAQNPKVSYPEKEAQVICLLVHGLNLKPSKMNWIAAQLLKNGTIVIHIELSGHGDNVVTDTLNNSDTSTNSLMDASWQLWQKDIEQGYQYMKKLNKEKNLPTLFVGYSLGGLLGYKMYAEATFDKYLLFSPAIELKSMPQTLIKASSLFPKLVIPSKSPIDYRENSGTPISAYNALIKGAEFAKAQNIVLENCYIIIDEQDELISYKKTKELALKNKYHLLTVDKSKQDYGLCKISHLTIDEQSLGTYTSNVESLIMEFCDVDF